MWLNEYGLIFDWNTFRDLYRCEVWAFVLEIIFGDGIKQFVSPIRQN